MTRYRVTLKVTVAMLPTLLQTVEKTRGIELDSIIVDAAANGAEPTPRRAREPRLPKADDNWLNTRTVRILIEAIQARGDKPFKIGQMADVLRKAEFSPKTASPILSKMKAAGYVKQDKFGGPYVADKPFPAA